jgi:peptidyl-dipeptidase Dcp
MNPFFEEYHTPFGIPPFDKITLADYKPAFEEGMKRQKAEIDAIVNNKQKPTFANTIEALENSGELLNKVANVFFNLNSAETNDSIQAIARDMAPLFSKHSDDISLNEKLFEKVKAVYDQRQSLQLNAEQSKLLEKNYKSFVRAGANLNAEQKTLLRKYNERLSVLSVQFGQNLLAETNAYQLFIDNKDDLAGLPQGVIEAAADAAQKAGQSGKWLFTLHNPSIMPFLQYSSKRELRKAIFEAYSNRGNNNNANDNKAIISEIAKLRLQRAQLLGFESYAAYSLDDKMAKTPANVYNLLNKVWEPAITVAKREATDIQQMINAENGNFQLEPWDWSYYAEKVRKERYDLDEEALKPYFKLDNVRQGAFDVAHKLYGLTFTELKDVPKYNPEVVTYEVKDEKGNTMAVLMMDFHPRASKRGGAWMTSYREEKKVDGKRIIPIISIVCNFTRPTASTPALLTFDEVTTLFHEFGHSLHGMLTQVGYESLSGTSVARDFVELPSQIMENWAAEPEVLKAYALHYQTNAPMPQQLIDKLTRSSYFNQGFATVEYLAASYLDMDYHTITDTADIDVLSFEKKSMNKIGLINQIIPRYRTTYFNHIWGGGYSAGYYSYLWAEVLDADAFDAFKSKGIFDAATAKSFRENVLEKGGTDEPMKLYINFRGAEPAITPLLKRRGLLEK